MTIKILNVFFALLFLLFAFVQINDPDPILWILIYLLMVAFSFMAFFEKYFSKLMWAVMAAYAVYLVLLFPGMMDWVNSTDRSLLFDDLAKMQYPYIEEAREFLGLVICMLVLGFYLFRSKK
jgi:Transmembrane family 220, helix